MNDSDYTIHVNIPLTPPQRVTVVPADDLGPVCYRDDDCESEESEVESQVDVEEEFNHGEIDWVEYEIVDKDDTIFAGGFLLKQKVKKDDAIMSIAPLPLFPGSPHTTQDFCRYMSALKASLQMGDQAHAMVVGSVLSFLPSTNTISIYMGFNPSVYQILKTVNMIADYGETLRTLKFDTCSGGCSVYMDDVLSCGQCKETRFTKCTMGCIDDYGQKDCCHPTTPRHVFHYMPVRDRIHAIVQSDLKNLLFYETYRHKSSEVSFITLLLRFCYNSVLLCKCYGLVTLLKLRFCYIFVTLMILFVTLCYVFVTFLLCFCYVFITILLLMLHFITCCNVGWTS